MKALKIVLWDRVNGFKTQEFSNPPFGMKLDADLENRTLTIDGVVKTVLDLAPGDVFELRVSEGVEL